MAAIFARLAASARGTGAALRRRPWAASAVAGLVIAGMAGVLAFSLMPHRGPAPVRDVDPALVPMREKTKAPAPRPKPRALRPSVFASEQLMSTRQLMNRWTPAIAEAARRFGVPQPWIRAVMLIESGGRTMLGEKRPIVSSMGAMGLMQLMPQTYDDMRRQYGLGRDPYDPHDNIMAGAAYLRFLRDRYGYPAMFAAYNDGPGNLEARMMGRGLLPAETQNYMSNITVALARGVPGGATVKFTRPNGAPAMVNAAAVVSIRAAFPGEYAPGVQTVITVGRLHQGVRESMTTVRAMLRAHGGGV
ncbi:MAG: lytic transglycosylase domain-containing protein [Rhizomicrobium sp.]